MQHPDEGTIHSWLDKALSAEEAAWVESHVSECPQCAAAVAEARGFIAGSSRILTALDDVPRAVVPGVGASSSPRKRDLRVLWRAAAAVLVVAGGSLIVLREDDQEVRIPAIVENGVAVESKAPAAMPDAGAAEGSAKGAGVAEDSRVAAPQSEATPLSNRRAVAPPTARVRQPVPSAERDFSGKGTSGGVSSLAGTTAGQAVGMDTAAPVSAARQLSANTVVAQGEVLPLKELKVERTLGTRRTVYEVSPTDTVTLTEIESLSLQGLVTTGAASGPDRKQKAAQTRAVAPMRDESAPAAAPPPPVAARADSGRADSAMASTEGAMMTQAAGAIRLRGATSNAAQNTIRWVESATGKTLILSGKLPVEKLQEIRQRIEIERAAARKKSP